MVVARDWAVDCAVLTFAKERPCGIYKQDYLVDLFERYGDADDCLEAPSKPSWEYGDAVGFDDTTEASTSVSHEDAEAENETGGPSILIDIKKITPKTTVKRRDRVPTCNFLSNGPVTEWWRTCGSRDVGEAKTPGKKFMDGLVKGAVLVTDSLKKKMLQGKIRELCGAKRDGFPGLQPVSLERFS
ncbi:hypothetical protein KIN20_030596 [Parelaphostrongylus tenuis]|uniref:Uncharacterized protein n=1 Tax=Parelaphostrongylus tenuis TaxID=148309 RepID=A0AAD5R4A2_PARTN|nr:hypothetical protein KIN20_030596 [Parelaphostrongylus tenuis]